MPEALTMPTLTRTKHRELLEWIWNARKGDMLLVPIEGDRSAQDQSSVIRSAVDASFWAKDVPVYISTQAQPDGRHVLVRKVCDTGDAPDRRAI